MEVWRLVVHRFVRTGGGVMSAIAIAGSGSDGARTGHCVGDVGRLQAARMETGAVAVHQYHGGGKVQRTGGQNAIRGLAVERFADQ